MGTESKHLCNIGQLPREGQAREIAVAGQTFCVVKLDGKVSVLDNECPHHGGPLGDGVIEDGKIVCPWHAYAFDLKTGVCDREADLRARVYATRVEGDNVLVEL